jgi:hypothetical protein
MVKFFGVNFFWPGSMLPGVRANTGRHGQDRPSILVLHYAAERWWPISALVHPAPHVYTAATGVAASTGRGLGSMERGARATTLGRHVHQTGWRATGQGPLLLAPSAEQRPATTFQKTIVQHIYRSRATEIRVGQNQGATRSHDQARPTSPPLHP